MGKTMSSTVEDFSHHQKLISNIQFLPGEILPLIFSYLPAEDCRNVRLTCKSWYQYSLERQVTRNQKFVFTEGESFDEIVRFLLKPISAVQLNLEFHFLSIDHLLPSVWEKFGHRVHTLYFRECAFGYSSLIDMIVNCVNLTSLTMEQNQDYDDDDDASDVTNSPTLLIDLIDKGLRRPKLRTFIWFHDFCHLSTIAVEQIFTLFPCIKYFGTGPRPSFDYQVPARAGVEEADRSAYSYFDECLNPLMQLERIIFNKPTDGSWIERSILKPEWSSRLIEFQTQLDTRNLPDFGRDLLFRFFADQKNLEIVTLNELNGDEVFARELMFCILENCPKLRGLQLRFENEDFTGERLLLRSLTFQTYAEFTRFFSLIAKLECFVLNFDIQLGFPSEMLSSLPATNFSMKELHLDQSKKSEIFCQTVLKHCSKLTYLKLGIIFDDILQEVFKNSDLETLKLCTYLYHDANCSKLTDYGFTGQSETRDEGSSIKQLQKLEHLTIGIYDRFHINTAGWQKESDGIFKRRSGITLKSIHEFQFPRLKSLDLYLELESQLKILDMANPDNASLDPNALQPSSWYCHVKPIFELPEQTAIHLVSSLPALEKLVITPIPDNFETVLRMCEQSEHLSILRCSRVNGFNMSRLFDTCPNIRHVELHEEGDEIREQFRRHPLTKEIQYRVLRRTT